MLITAGPQNHVAPEQLYAVPPLAHALTAILIVGTSAINLTLDTDQQQTVTSGNTFKLNSYHPSPPSKRYD